TGPDPQPDQLVSVACIPVERGKVILRKAFEATFPAGGALELVVEALTGRVLVAHGASRHLAFLSPVLDAARLRLYGPALHSAMLAAGVPPRTPRDRYRSWSPSVSPPRLPEAASGVGLPVHRPHEAGGEALTTAQLFMALASRLDRVHPQSVGSLA